MAFIFPDPSELQAVTNPTTGVNYIWKEDASKWVVASQTKALSEAITEDLQDLEDRVDAIEDAGIDTDSLTYMLQTNSITGGASPAIDLVDSEDGFSNVKIEGVNGINVTSTASSIVIDGSDVQAIADLDDYYTKTEVDAADQHLQNQVDELLTTKGAASVYTLNDVDLVVGIRPGDFYVDNTVAKDVSFITLAPVDNNGNARPLGAVGDILELVKSDNTTYQYKITTAGDGLAGVEFQVAVDPEDLLIPGMTFNIYIYPQNKTTASIDYVNSGLSEKMGLTGNQEITSTFRLKESDRTYFRIQDDELSLYHVAYPAAAEHAANQQYVNDEVGKVDAKLVDYYKKFGGEYIEGHVNITNSKTIRIDKTEGDKQFQIYPAAGDGAYGTTIYAYNNGSITLRLAEGQAQNPYVGVFDARKQTHTVGGNSLTHKSSLSYLQTPTKPDHAANKQYVDDKVAGVVSVVEAEDAEPDIHYGTAAPTESGDGDLWVDTTNMRLLMRVNGAWVNPDRQESVVDLSPYQKIVSPPGRKFKKANATNPQTSGTFTYYETNGQVKLALNRRDAEGTKWLDINFTDNLNAPVLFRIVQWQNNTTHKTVRYGAIDKIVAADGGHVTCDVKYHSTNGSLENNSNYFIIIGGLL